MAQWRILNQVTLAHAVSCQSLPALIRLALTLRQKLHNVRFVGQVGQMDLEVSGFLGAPKAVKRDRVLAIFILAAFALVLSGCGAIADQRVTRPPTNFIVSPSGELLAAIDASGQTDTQVFSLETNRASSAIINTLTPFSHQVELQRAGTFSVLTAFPEGRFQAVLDIDPISMRVVRQTDLDMRPYFQISGYEPPSFSPDFMRIGSFRYSACTAVGGGDFAVAIPNRPQGDGVLLIRRGAPPFYLDGVAMCLVIDDVLILAAAQSEDTHQIAVYRFCAVPLEQLRVGQVLCHQTSDIESSRLGGESALDGPSGGALLPNGDLLILTLDEAWLVPLRLVCSGGNCQVAPDGEPRVLYAASSSNESYLVELTFSSDGSAFAVQELTMHDDGYAAQTLLFRNRGGRDWSVRPVAQGQDEHEVRILQTGELIFISGEGRSLETRRWVAEG